MIIDFYISFLQKEVYKSFIYDVNLKFIQPTLENRFKNFEFPIIIDFYALLLKKRVYNSFIHDA